MQKLACLLREIRLYFQWTNTLANHIVTILEVEFVRDSSWLLTRLFESLFLLQGFRGDKTKLMRPQVQNIWRPIVYYGERKN